MKLNRIYYKHLRKSILLVALGLAVVMYGVLPIGQGSDTFLILIMAVLSGFSGFLGAIMLLARYDRGVKFRRKFVYCFFGVANAVIGLISMVYFVLHKDKAFKFSIVVYILGFLIGAAILIDIFFGKRPARQEREVLID